MTVMDDWLAEACRELGLDPADVDVPLVLDLAKDVAHHVLRPGAPVTAYLLGLAVGRGAGPAEAAGRLGVAARSWSDRPPAVDTPANPKPTA